MTEQEVKQSLIDNYINLLRIKAAETATNKELEIQLKVAKIKLDRNRKDDFRIIEERIHRKGGLATAPTVRIL